MARENPLGWDALNGKFEVAPSGCWIWQKSRNTRGYGHISIHGKRWRAHRLAYTLSNKAIPKGLHVCHRCDVPACVNPAHLFLGTAQDNYDDSRAKGRRGYPLASNGYCWRGHERDASSTYTRPDGRIECRTCRKSQPSNSVEQRRRIYYAVQATARVAALAWRESELWRALQCITHNDKALAIRQVEEALDSAEGTNNATGRLPI